MIQDIFKMPFATTRDWSFSSTVPLIFYNNGLCAEDYYWLGRDLDISQLELESLHRYKFLEYVGDLCVERVIVADGEFSLADNWEKSDIKIYPVYAKRFHLRKNRVSFDRYLNGCWDMLDVLSCNEENLRTIHDYLIRHLDNWRDIPGLKKDKYFDSIITGKTKTNLENFSATLQCSTLDYDWDNEFYNELLKVPAIIQPDKVEDKTSEKYVKTDITLKSLAKMKTRNSGLWTIGMMTGTPARLFDPNGKDVKYGFTTDYAKWEQIGILDSLQWSNFTDIYFDIELLEQGKYNFKALDMLNRYTGSHVDHTNIELNMPATKFLMELVIALSKCSLEFKGGKPVSQIRFLMNWFDEIYVEIVVNGKTYRIWYDTTITTLADPGMVPLR